MATSLPSSSESNTDSGEIMHDPVEVQNSVLSSEMVAGKYHYNNDENQITNDSKEKSLSRLGPDLSYSHNTAVNNLRGSKKRIDFDDESIESNDDFSLRSSNHFYHSDYDSNDLNRRTRQFEYNEPNDSMSRRPKSHIDLKNTAI